MPSVKNKLFAWGLILLGSTAWSLTMVKSGLLYPFGLGFWGPNGHDGIWHLALAQSLSQGSLAMPVFAGSAIQNYHLGFDILLALLHRLTFLPVSVIYFQLLPPLMAVCIGLLTYRLVYTWKNSSSSAWWSVFFVYFSGSFGWLLGKGESVFWAQQSLSSLINPPYALSLIVILLALIFLHHKHFLLAILCFAILPEIKIYAGVLAFFGLFVMALKNRSLFKVFIPAAVLAALIFLPFNLHSASLLRFSPGWFLQSMFSPDHLNWPRFFSALNTYLVGGIWYKAIPAYFLALIIFLLGNLGLRLIFLFTVPRKPDSLYLFFLSMLSAGIVLPMVFIQSGTAWNTIQFFYYTQFICSILAGITVSTIRSRKLFLPVAFILILVSVPTAFDTLRNYLPSRPPAKISQDELSVLAFLARQPPGTVLTYPFDRTLADAAIPFPPRPLYLYESTAYVSAYSGHSTFLADQVNLDITAYPWSDRRQQVMDFFAHPRPAFLVQNSIRYLYLAGPPPLRFTLGSLSLTTLMSSPEVSLYLVRP